MTTTPEITLPPLPLEGVRARLSYDSATGVFRWVDSDRPDRNGKVAGFVRGTRTKYLYICIGQRKYRVHRLAWFIHYGEWPRMIDHINGDPMDNRIDNLRSVTNAQNQQNSKLPRNNTSGFKGVTLSKIDWKWHAKINVDSKKIFIGRFDDPLHAAHAYNKAAIQYHGEFACLNPL